MDSRQKAKRLRLVNRAAYHRAEADWHTIKAEEIAAEVEAIDNAAQQREIDAAEKAIGIRVEISASAAEYGIEF